VQRRDDLPFFLKCLYRFFQLFLIFLIDDYPSKSKPVWLIPVSFVLQIGVTGS